MNHVIRHGRVPEDFAKVIDGAGHSSAERVVERGVRIDERAIWARDENGVACAVERRLHGTQPEFRLFVAAHLTENRLLRLRPLAVFPLQVDSELFEPVPQ